MPAPSNTDEFLDLVRKSGLLDERKLDAYLDKLRAGSGLPAKSTEVAGLLVRDGLLTTFQAEQILQGKWRRFTIGKYKVLEKLGSGGMGSVFLAEHKLMRRRVAVKILPAAKADDPASLERFYREARAVAALDHPNIVRAYDIDQDEKLHFLVMEYVDGASLQEIVKRGGALDPVRAAHYIRQAALGVQHAHEAAGLVHRDIKPGNILVDRLGTVKVLDMGLARFFHDEDDILTKKYDENVLGTADYLAPEQALDSHAVDIRADIYSLGATFYFCLTGKTPFTEGTVAQKLIWHQTRQPKPIRAIRADVPEGLVAIVERMMAKDPGQRYQAPHEVVQALEPWTQTPIPPPPDAEMPRLSPAAMGATAPSDSQLPSPLPSVRGPASPPPPRSWQPSSQPTPRPPTKPPAGPALGSPPPTVTVPAAPTRPIRPPAPPATAPTPPPPTRAPTTPATRAARGANGRPPAAPAVEPPSEEPAAPWEQLALDTDASAARADTGPGKATSAARSRVQEAQQRVRPWWELVLVGMMIFAAVAAGLIYLIGLIWNRPNVAATHPALELRTLRVSKAAAGPGTFPSLRAALHEVRAGEHIVIQEDAIEDTIPLDHTFPKGVSIEGEAGKTVVWRARPGSNPADLLHVEGVEGLRVKNLTLDGGGALDRLIMLLGTCPGLTLEDLELRGYRGCGVLVMQCQGTSERPVTFKGLKCSSKGAKAGLMLELAEKPANYPVNSNRFFQVIDCHGDPVVARGTSDLTVQGKPVPTDDHKETAVPLP